MHNLYLFTYIMIEKTHEDYVVNFVARLWGVVGGKSDTITITRTETTGF